VLAEAGVDPGLLVLDDGVATGHLTVVEAGAVASSP